MSREEIRQKLRELQADNPITDEEIVEAIRASRLDEVLDQPFEFGLRAQGKLETVERMLADGKTWDEIGAEIGWAPDAAERFWKAEGKSMNDWDELIRQLNALPGDWEMKISVASECYWSAEVRWTEEPNADGPDVSLVTFAVAGETPEEVAREAVDAILIRQNRAI